MRRHEITVAATTALAAVGLIASSACPGVTRYTITDLGSLGGDYTYPYAINNSGQVVGQSRTSSYDGGPHAFYWANGKMVDLGIPDGDSESRAFSINDSGQVVISSSITASRQISHAFLWNDGTLTDLGTLPNGVSIYAGRINSSGQVLGNVRTADGRNHPVLYSNGTMTDLGTFSTSSESFALGFNDNGQIIGSAANTSFIYKIGARNPLTYLPAPPNGWTMNPVAINNGGQVAGTLYQDNSPVQHAFFYSNGKMTDLGTLNGAVRANVYGMNDRGQVVGRAIPPTSGGYDRAFLYEDGMMTDLNTLIPSDSGWTLYEARSINNLGQIVGYGLNSTPTLHGFLLTPVGLPEPASAALFGLMGAAALSRRGLV